VFVGWGRALAISEFSHEGELLFDASLLRKNKSYRAFRFPWSGQRLDRPACVAERASEEELRACADRLATFHTCRFSERLSGLFITH
jgi:hypothetical protein